LPSAPSARKKQQRWLKRTKFFSLTSYAYDRKIRFGPASSPGPKLRLG
jgi:hypothetical protein